MVGAIDLYPTILDAVGLERPEGHIVDGVSFLSVLEQTGLLDRDAYFTWLPHLIPAVSVRQGDWKLIEFYEDMHVELYNLKDDIGETDDLARAMPELAARLKQKLDHWRVSVDAQMTRQRQSSKVPKRLQLPAGQ